MYAVAKKSCCYALLSLMLLGCCCQAQPTQDRTEREQRQLKNGPGGTTEADVKMLAGGTANITPAAMQMQLQLPMSGLGGQLGLARYPNHPGLSGYPGYAGYNGLLSTPFLGMPNIANNYPSYTDPSQGLGLGLGLGAAGFPGTSQVGGFPQVGGYPQAGGYPQVGGYPQAGGFAGNPQAGGFPGNPQTSNFMYPNPMYAQTQLGNGFGQQPTTVDNFAALNNIINMANQQGLGASGLYAQGAGTGTGLYAQGAGTGTGLYAQGAGAGTGLYAQGAGHIGMPGGFFGAGAGDGMSMSMHSYAPGF